MDAAVNLWTVMAGRVAKNARPVLDPAALGIVSAVIKPADPREGNRGGTHGARLESHVKITLRQPRRAEALSPGLQNTHLGMAGCIVVLLGTVAGGRNDLSTPVIDQHRADRDFPRRAGRARDIQRLNHIFVFIPHPYKVAE